VDCTRLALCPILPGEWTPIARLARAPCQRELAPILIPTALLGGSFNPAHNGHRQVSLWAIDALGVEELWWLISPGNPLKEAARDMAPLPARFASAQKVSRRSRIRPTVIERRLRTRYTVETLEKLVRRYPNRRFIWLMGADNLAQFHLWRNWRRIARLMPIAVIARPGYNHHAQASRAMGWFRQFVHPVSHAKDWTKWRPPALVLLRFRPDKTSATALRRADPDWYLPFTSLRLRDPVTRRLIN
jgi:nicotinate-nucleotide adenylyltransferase